VTPVHYDPGPARKPSLGYWLEVRGKRLATRLLYWLLHPRPWTDEELARLPLRQLLIIRQHNQMGDMVLCLPTLSAIRRQWPQAHLRFVTAPICEELLRDHADIDELLVFRKRAMQHPAKLFAWLRQLRSPRADLAIVLGSVSFSTTSAMLALASGAGVRIGASSRPFGSDLSRAIFHRELSAPTGEHEVERNLSTLQAIGIQEDATLPGLRAAAESVRQAAAFLGQSASAGSLAVDWVVLHAGAGKLPNIWPAEYFAELANRLAENPQLRMVLTEGPLDAAFVDAVQTRSRAAFLRWRRPLGETMGLLQQAALVVSNDTGMAHVSAALGRPTLVLFGPTDPNRWRPAGPRVAVLQSPSSRIIDLSVDAVFAGAIRLLGHNLGHEPASTGS
jgi:ADP-heptose:LPS heptosyltransferase